MIVRQPICLLVVGFVGVLLLLAGCSQGRSASQETQSGRASALDQMADQDAVTLKEDLASDKSKKRRAYRRRTGRSERDRPFGGGVPR